MKIDRVSLGLVFFLTLVGLAVRISAPLSGSFPLNDGGLFYKMILDLQGNHFILPDYTTYNNAALPFAYPPFAFYFYGLIASAGKVSVLKLMQFLPSIVSALTVPAFYLLAKEILDSKAQAALALLAFTFVPRAFDWLIMGGGVTRAFGLLFALLAMRQSYIFFSRQSQGTSLAMIGLGALVVYTHPEAVTHTVISAVFFYLWKDRSMKGLMRAIIAALGILLITTPWWLTILTRHGLDPFLAAMSAAKQNSYNALTGLLILFRFDFTEEPNLTLIAILGLIGIFTLLAKRKFFIPLWFFLMHLLEPRGGALFMMIPLAMFAGIGLDQTILPGLRNLNPGQLGMNNEDWASSVLKGKTVKIFLAILFMYTSLSALQVGAGIKQRSTLTQADLDAFNWVEENTPPNSHFALVTRGLPLNDASSEWFPALTGRTSLATVFGYEWLNDGKFGARVEIYQELQKCTAQDVDCLNHWAQEIGRGLSYVYVRKQGGGHTALDTNLSNSADYTAVYDTTEIVIYLKQ